MEPWPRDEGAAIDHGVAVPQFYGSEISDIQAYIRTAARVREQTVILLPPPDPVRGQRLFQMKRCTACHGLSGRGTEFGPGLRAAVQHLRAAEIAGELWNHSATMSEAIAQRGVTFPEFVGTELADVIAYLYYLRFEETAGDVSVGKALFAIKGCTRCHALDGGESVGPDLSASAAVVTPMGLTTAMWNHAPSMYEQAQQAGYPWPLFLGNEMRDLAAYLHSLSSPSSKGG